MNRPTDRSPLAAGTTLIVPGYRGSDGGHWQTWMESRIPGARRVSGIDWDTPAVAVWAAAIRREITAASAPVWLVAHSFGCLAAVLAGTDRSERVAGALLVAPADPECFSPVGLRQGAGLAAGSPVSLTPFMPKHALDFPSLVVASRNDPWMPWPRVRRWARLWNSKLIEIGEAGHINPDSGFGSWPEGIDLFRTLQTSRDH